MLPAEGSLVALVTVAVLARLVPANDGGVLKVLRIVFDWPERIVPRLQGKAVVQAPLLKPKVAPAGVGSLTTTAVASDGPLLITVMV